MERRYELQRKDGWFDPNAQVALHCTSGFSPLCALLQLLIPYSHHFHSQCSNFLVIYHQGAKWIIVDPHFLVSRESLRKTSSQNVKSVFLLQKSIWPIGIWMKTWHNLVMRCVMCSAVGLVHRSNCFCCLFNGF